MSDSLVWEAMAEYEDGTRIEKTFPFYERNYHEECQRQYELECWLIERHEGCTFYSVCAIAE